MIELKTPEEIKIMKAGGRILAKTLREVAKIAQEGVTLDELNRLAEKTIREAGATPAFLGYQPTGANEAYPASICTSVNEVVVHGIPSQRPLRQGDIVKIDCGVLHKGYYTDSAITVPIGEISPEVKKLLEATKKALELAINECRIGKTVGDIGYVIADQARKYDLKPLKGLTGHGIGKELHQEPTIYNEGEKGTGLSLQEGMVLAIEPMFSMGSDEIQQLVDESYATKDDSLSSHFEHTVAITKLGPEVLTK